LAILTPPSWLHYVFGAFHKRNPEHIPLYGIWNKGAYFWNNIKLLHVGFVSIHHYDAKGILPAYEPIRPVN
jgi:hypothetical protein